MKPDVLPIPTSDHSKLGRQTSPSTGAEGELTYAKILVPIDFSEGSNNSTSYAARFSTRYNSTLVLVHVFDFPGLELSGEQYINPSSDLLKSQADAAAQAAGANLTAIENQLRNRGIKAESYQRVGCPFDEIVKMARYFQVDLIIIGSHGRTGLAHLLLGSVAERVVEYAPCPVLVVKRPFHCR
jgi:universal stress protein A